MFAMCEQRKVCLKREHTFGIIMEAQRFQVITLTVLLLCAIFGVTQGVSAEITEEKEGNSGIFNLTRKEFFLIFFTFLF